MLTYRFPNSQKGKTEFCIFIGVQHEKYRKTFVKNVVVVDPTIIAFALYKSGPKIIGRKTLAGHNQ